MITGTADTVALNVTANGVLCNGGVLRYANFLNSLSLRPPLNIGFSAGALIGAIQAA